MKKFCAIACTLGFSAFWVFGGLAVISLVQGHPVSALVLVLCGLGLAVGIVMRRRVVQMTQDVPVGRRVAKQETAAA
ncbi:hypothetical protein E7811_10085 [Aliigemmobacter aestuarii]|uniref:Uncharacterized protein n=1 Tax=Aliigemmobacter aestuarii TaxID=1445661 RepID=A0A4S3MMX9_9RHOB|nr:hypothetical protein [Gemmobacter aestuarii]THD83617.1 hypothetical protein E7811_10085 [Gemmobacter aestuarii]